MFGDYLVRRGYNVGCDFVDIFGMGINSVFDVELLFCLCVCLLCLGERLLPFAR